MDVGSVAEGGEGERMGEEGEFWEGMWIICGRRRGGRGSEEKGLAKVNRRRKTERSTDL